MTERGLIIPEQTRIGIFSAYEMEESKGGVREKIVNTAEQLRKLGYPVAIIAPRDPNTEPSGQYIHLGKASAHKTNGTVALTDTSLESPWTIWQLHKTLNLDIAHYHEPEISGPSMESLLLSNAINFTEFHSYNPKEFKLKFFLISRLQYLLAHKISEKILVSESQRPYAEYYFPGKPFRVIPNGIDTQKFNPDVPKIEELMDGHINLLYVGRLEERKGLRYLLAAFKEAKATCPDLKLIIAGSGPQRAELERIVASEEIGDVRFEGQIPDHDKPAYFATADIFCSPALYGESFGIVLLEAMASGVPVIAGDNPGYRSVIKGEEGILVNPQDIHQFAGYIVQLASSKEERQIRGGAGNKKAQDFAWPRVVGGLEDLYIENLLEKRAEQRRC